MGGGIMGVKLGSSSGGSVEIAAPATASNFTLTAPAATDTLVGIAATQTLTNKTLTSPTINSASVPTISGTAPLYMCRAWVNFNGVGTVAIRASGNVSSITDNGTGDYTVNFTTAMPDANYTTALAVTPDAALNSVRAATRSFFVSTTTTTTAKIVCGYQAPDLASEYLDYPGVYVAIFR